MPRALRVLDSERSVRILGRTASPLARASWVFGHSAYLLDLAPTASVAAWPDESGSSNALSQASSTLAPTVAASIHHGLPGVLFDGTNDRLTWPGAVLNPRTTAFTLLALLQTAAADTSDRVLIGNDEGTPVFLLHANNGAGAVSVFVRDSGGQSISVAGAADLRGAVHLIGLTWDPVTKALALRVDGAQVGTATNASLNISTIPSGFLGAGCAFRGGSPRDSFFRSYLLELHGFSEVLGGSALTDREAYLLSL